MGEEAAPEVLDGLLHALAQGLQGARALLPPQARPALQPALLGPLRLHAALVAEHPEHREVGVELALEDRLQVDLHVGLPGQAPVVPEDAQEAAVGDESPQVLVGAVQKLLHQAVRACLRRSGHAARAPVQLHPGAHEVDGRLSPEVAHGVALALDLQAPRGLKPAVAKLLEEREKQALAREPRGRLRGPRALPRVLEARPLAAHPVPGARDGLAQALGAEVVVLRAQPRKLAPRCGEARDDVGRDEPALGAHREEAVVARAPHAAPPDTGSRT